MLLERVGTTDRFVALRQEWLSLWNRADFVTPFQHPDWLIAWWRVFGNGQLSVIAEWDQNRLVGLAPLFEQDSVCTLLGNGITDYLDLLVETNCDTDFLAYIAQRPFDLDCLREGSSLLKLTGERVRSSLSPVLKLPASANSFDASLTHHFLKNLRRAERVLKDGGRLRIGTAAVDEVQETLTAFFNLHRRRWARLQLPGVLNDPAVQTFHRQVAAPLVAGGVLRLYTMTLNAVPIAVLYILVRGAAVYFYLGAFEPDLSRHSPGSVLLYHAIIDAIESGAKEFHFLRGDETYKQRWNAVATPLWRIRTRR